MPLKENRTTALFRLRTILLIVNLAVLVLPLGSAFFFRFYENELVRQTELELISQGALLAASYKQELLSYIGNKDEYGLLATKKSPVELDELYAPINPQLDLSRTIVLPRRPEGVVVSASVSGPEFTAAKSLTPIIAEAQKTTLSGVRILDYKGTVVSGPKETGLSFAEFPEVQMAMEGAYNSVIRQRISDSPSPALASISRGTNIRVFVAYPVLYNDHVWGVIYLSRTPKNILKYLHAEKDRVIMAGVTILVLTILLAFLTSYTISQPIYRLVDKTKKIAAGDRTGFYPLESPGTKEVEILSESFLKMASALQERSEYIRNFAAHVSHELKTPLTSIRGAAELLQDHDLKPAEKEHFLSLIVHDTDRLKRMVTRLLELARADNLTPTNESANIAGVLNKLEKRYTSEGLSVAFSQKEDLLALVSADNLETIFVNLFDNALQHQATRIEVNIKSRDHSIILEIQDNGTGISPANVEKVFTPFFTTRREGGGTGLGLDIVMSILRNHNGAIKVADSAKGARFVIDLPRA